MEHRIRFALALAPLLSITLLVAAAVGQCSTVLLSGGPIASLRGFPRVSALWDPDGAGPLPQWLVVGGLSLTGGDQTTPTGLIAFDGVQWRGLNFTVNEQVRALTVFNGELIAAGSFTLGGAAHRIARRNATTWNVLGSGMDDDVHALTVFAGNLIAGGQFSTAGGVAAVTVAQWNGSSWSALPQAPTPIVVNALATFGSLYVSTATLSLTNAIYRWDGSNWSVAATMTSSGFPLPSVDSLASFVGATQGSSFLVAAGVFSSINGVATQNVARAGSGAATWSAMGGGLPQMPSAQLFTRATFLGAPEVIATGAATNSTARVLRWTGTTWNQLGNLGPSTGSATATAPGFYGGYVAGLQTPGASLRDPAMFRFAGDWRPLLGKGISSPVHCFAFDGADAIAGGAFASIDGVAVNGIARRSGTTWSALGTGMTGGTATVQAVARAANGDVFAGGSFTTAGGNAASNVARWNGTAWAPLGSGTDGTVRALLVAANGDLIAGGDFLTAGGIVCSRIARWDGSAWSPLASGTDDAVHCLAALANGQIVAGGTFLLAGGNICNHIATWDGVAWTSMAGGTDGAVNALALRPDGQLAAGGAFTAAGGNPRPRLARWDGSTWLPLGPGVPDTVHALAALPNGDVLIGGRFAAGTMNHLARWESAANGIAAVGSGIDGPDVLAFAAAPNGDVFVGGDFDAILPTLASGNLAILRSSCPAQALPVPTACVGPGGPLSLVADTLPWLGSTFRSTASGFAPASFAIAVLGFSPVSVPLAAVLPVGLPNCDLLAAPDMVSVAVPVAGSSQYQFVLSSSPAFVGVPLSHQFVQLEFAPSGAMQSLSSSNALTLVPGLL